MTSSSDSSAVSGPAVTGPGVSGPGVSGTPTLGAALERLEATIAQRRAADPDKSYVARLFGKGLGKIAQKLGEEGVETVIAALSESREAVVGEAADLLFHLAVLLAARDIRFADVLAELDRREGTSGIVEKAARKG